LDYYNHVFIPGFATSFPLPAGELKLASNSRYESAELRARAEYWASPVFVDSCLGSLLINNTAF